MAAPELTEEEVFDNDKDPLEAIREIRRAEGVSEDDLPERTDISDASDILEQDPHDPGTSPEIATDEEDDDEAQGKEPDEADEPEELEEAAEGRQVDDEPEKGAEATADAKPEKEKAEEPGEEAAEKDAGAEEPEGPVVHKFKANGQEYEFTQEEMMEQFGSFFGKAVDYTQKMQKIAPYRKMISALEQEGVSQTQLNVAIDALKGDKGALLKLMQDNKLDPYELAQETEGESPYQPRDYGKSEKALEIDEITGMIQGEEEFKITSNVIDEQWDGRSRQIIVENPRMILGLHSDIKSGIYDKVAPLAMKMKVLDGSAKSDIEYYMAAGQQFAQQLQAQEQPASTEPAPKQKTAEELNAEAQSVDTEFEEASSEAERKRAASSTGARAGRKGVIDYLDDDDEAFDDWYAKNIGSRDL